MPPVAHIAGVPVEETLGVLAPSATLVLGALGAVARSRLRHRRYLKWTPAGVSAKRRSRRPHEKRR